VSDTDKRPVGGRLVVLVSRAEGEALRVTSTDEKGRYQFHDLPPGMYEIRLEADGFMPEVKKDIDVRPPFQNIVDVILRPATAGAGATAAGPSVVGAPLEGSAAGSGGGEVVQGVLRDAEGSPVVEAEVLLAPLAGGALRQGMSDEKGTFRMEGVAPGAYRLIVRSLGHVPIDVSRVDVVAGGGLSLRLSLVDYALDFVTGKDLRQVQERPRPRTAPGAPPAGAPSTGAASAAPGTPPATRMPAPEPEGDPLVPPPPAEKSTTPPPADSG
jgi:carboxypeptidase family protein